MEPEALIQHGSFVRALAKSLLFDDHAVDDVVQETWAAYVRRPPRETGAARAWLRTVVRRYAIDRLQSRRRVGELDRVAAKKEAVPSTAEVVERETARREVVDAVLALSEPYRSAVLLRYYEDLAPRHIAARLSIPVETVRTHLKRGLAQIREKLDSKHGGDRRAWCVGLIPIAAPATKALGLGAFAAAASIAALLLVGTIHFSRPQEEHVLRDFQPPATSVASVPAPASLKDFSESELIEPAARASVPIGVFSGSVAGPNGAPIPNARVRFSDEILKGLDLDAWKEDVERYTDFEGRFSLPVPPNLPNVEIAVERGGFQRAEVSFLGAPASGAVMKAPFTVILQRIEPLNWTVRGKILTPQGAPFPPIEYGSLYTASSLSIYAFPGVSAEEAMKWGELHDTGFPRPKEVRFAGDYSEEDGTFAVSFWREAEEKPFDEVAICVWVTGLPNPLVQSLRLADIKAEKELLFTLDHQEIQSSWSFVQIRLSGAVSSEEAGCYFLPNSYSFDFRPCKSSTLRQGAIGRADSNSSGAWEIGIPGTGCHDVLLTVNGYGGVLLENLQLVAGKTIGPIEIELRGKRDVWIEITWRTSEVKIAGPLRLEAFDERGRLRDLTFLDHLDVSHTSLITGLEAGTYRVRLIRGDARGTVLGEKTVTALSFIEAVEIALNP